MSRKIGGTAKFLHEVFTEKGGIEKYKNEVSSEYLWIGIAIGTIVTCKTIDFAHYLARRKNIKK